MVQGSRGLQNRLNLRNCPVFYIMIPAAANVADIIFWQWGHTIPAIACELHQEEPLRLLPGGERAEKQRNGSEFVRAIAGVTSNEKLER